MKKIINRSFILVLHLFLAGYYSYGQVNKVADIEANFGGRCSPIVLVPESPMNAITRRMFVEKNYEIAIFPSPNYSEKYIIGLLVCKKESEYHCYLKRLHFEGGETNNVLSDENIKKYKLDVADKKINSEFAKTLAEFLRKNIIKAKYETLQEKNRIYTTNNVNYNVYVRGISGDEYDHYSATITDPVRKTGQSCSAILFALTELVLADDDGNNLKSIDKLINYLKSVTSGDNGVVDPFAEKHEPEDESDLDLPPI